jgi:hypothetical protein
VRSRKSKFDRFPRLGGTILPKDEWERSRYLKFFNEPMKLGIAIPLKSLYFKLK